MSRKNLSRIQRLKRDARGEELARVRGEVAVELSRLRALRLATSLSSAPRPAPALSLAPYDMLQVEYLGDVRRYPVGSMILPGNHHCLFSGSAFEIWGSNGPVEVFVPQGYELILRRVRS